MRLFVVAIAMCFAAVVSAQADGAVGAPSAEYLPPVGANEATQLAEDGYRYKAVRRLKYRHRREAPSQEYLPPVAEPTQEYLPPDAAETKVADDGYRYKTVRRLRYRTRRRRDVSEIAPPSNEYLPPVDVELAPDLKTIVGDDGYRYRTVRRLKYRRRRREVTAEEATAGDSVDAPNVEYLPPSNDVAVEEPASKSAELANDGYRYKTVRRIRYRYRQ